MTSDLQIYSEEHLLAQLETAPYTNGYFTLRFYADQQHKPSKERTGSVEEFYLYPSGGTLRDKEYSLIWYAARFDTSHGFVPPNQAWRKTQDVRTSEEENT